MDAWAVLHCLHSLPVPDSADDAELTALCRAAIDELTPRIRADADLSDARLLRAAAGIAYLLYAVRRTGKDDDVTYFKAGDVTIHRNDTSPLPLARELRDEGIRQALPLLRDDAFLFTAV